MAGISKRLSAAQLKAFRVEKRKERLAKMDRAMALRNSGLSLQEVADELGVPFSTAVGWIALRTAAERAVVEHRAKVAS